MNTHDFKILETHFEEISARSIDKNGYILSDLTNSTSGFLYVHIYQDDRIKVEVHLPNSLDKKYGNASNLNGIRVYDSFASISKAAEYVSELFSDFGKFYEFVDKSVDGVIGAPKGNSVKPKGDARAADKHFKIILKEMDMPALINKYGTKTLIEARKILTIGEFKDKYT